MTLGITILPGVRAAICRTMPLCPWVFVGTGSRQADLWEICGAKGTCRPRRTRRTQPHGRPDCGRQEPACRYQANLESRSVGLSSPRCRGGYDPDVEEDSFWSLITECREHSGNDTELMSRVLFRRLRALAAGDVTAFAWHWERARSALYSWPVADAACLLLGTVEEEHLRFIQDWVISFGASAVTSIAQDPDSLANLAYKEHRQGARAVVRRVHHRGSHHHNRRHLAAALRPARPGRTELEGTSTSMTTPPCDSTSRDWPRSGATIPDFSPARLTEGPQRSVNSRRPPPSIKSPGRTTAPPTYATPRSSPRPSPG